MNGQENLLFEAYRGGWRKSKKYAKETNFHGLNRAQIKEHFDKWCEANLVNKQKN